MRTSSEGIANLAAALVAAQGAIENVVKETTNPFFKSKYADLAAIRAAIREPLQQNGLAIVQDPVSTPAEYNSDGALVRPQSLTLETTIIHKSGEWKTISYPITPVTDNKANAVTPQTMGSAITYARRYSLQCLLNLAAEDEDDDGNTASSQRSGNTGAAAQQEAKPAASRADQFMDRVTVSNLSDPSIRQRIKSAFANEPADVQAAIGEQLTKLLEQYEKPAQPDNNGNPPF